MTAFPPAILALADGTVFHGRVSVPKGAPWVKWYSTLRCPATRKFSPIRATAGRSLPLPIRMWATPVNAEDCESGKIHAAGLVIRDPPIVASNWRTQQTPRCLSEGGGVVAIAGIDTRRLTRVLREKGAQAGCILTAADVRSIDVDQAVAAAREFPGLAGMDLAKVPAHARRARLPPHRGAGADTCRRSAGDVADGIFLSNGPGDPEPCDYAIAAISRVPLARHPGVSGSAWGTS